MKISPNGAWLTEIPSYGIAECTHTAVCQELALIALEAYRANLLNKKIWLSEKSLHFFVLDADHVLVKHAWENGNGADAVLAVRKDGTGFYYPKSAWNPYIGRKQSRFDLGLGALQPMPNPCCA